MLRDDEELGEELIRVNYLRTHVAPSETNRLHCHPFYEILLIDKGGIRYSTPDGYTDVTGKTVIFHCVHDIHNPFVQYSQLYDRYRIQFDRSLLDGYFKFHDDIDTALSESYIKHLEDREFEEIYSLTRKLYELSDGVAVTKPEARICLYLAMIIMKCFDAVPIKSPAEESYITEVADYINRNCNKPLTIESIAESFFVSRGKLIYDFKRYSNISILEYITATRIKMAKECLTKGFSVSGAAAECGFSSSSYFIAQFKSTKGISPAKYRKSFNTTI